MGLEAVHFLRAEVTFYSSLNPRIWQRKPRGSMLLVDQKEKAEREREAEVGRKWRTLKHRGDVDWTSMCHLALA